MSTVVPRMRSGGNTKVQTAIVGTNWTAFPSITSILHLVIVNTTGTDIEFCQDLDTTNPVTVLNGSTFDVYGISNANQISVRRVDVSNTQVTLKARWEA